MSPDSGAPETKPNCLGFPIAAGYTFTVVGILPGEHQVDVQWAKQAGSDPAATITIPAATTPSAFGANMIVKEYAE